VPLLCLLSLPLACEQREPQRVQVATGQPDLYASSGAAPAASPASPASAVGATATGSAQEHLDLARRRFGARDGKGCIEELDAHDRLEPRPLQKTTDPGASFAAIRANCMMLAGDCDGGKAFFVRAMSANNPSGMSPAMLARTSENTAAMYCVGDKLSPRDQVLRASTELTQAATGMKQLDSAGCRRNYDTVKQVSPQLPPAPDEDQAKQAEKGLMWSAPNCFARAGDCASALSVHRIEMGPRIEVKDPAQREKALQSTFESTVPLCKKP
jgi:hypothetical protein